MDGAGCGGHNGSRQSTERGIVQFSQVAVMRTKNRRQMRLAGEVPVEVAPTRMLGRLCVKFGGCGMAAEVVMVDRIIAAEGHCYFVLFTSVVVLKRLFK